MRHRWDETIPSRGSAIHIVVIFTAADLITAALHQLPTDALSIVESHFLDGESIFKIQRNRGLPYHDVKAAIAAALVTMRKALQDRGVRGAGDVI